jgi:hypothetical protein
MLWNASKIKGRAIAARDGTAGQVVDYLFDDISWHVRWAVVDTSGWLSGRKVLLPTSALGPLETEGRDLSIELTMQQVKDSPDIDTERPVSRQMETHLYDHYGWAPYWGEGLYMGAYGYGAGFWTSPPLEKDSEEREILEARRDHDDPHLRSIEAVTGYHLHARDGEVGHVEDFLIDDSNWGVHYMVVDTKNWWPGKRVLISPRSVQGFDWKSRLVNTNVDREAVKASPLYDPSTTVDPAYETRFNEYYGGIGPSLRK